MFNDIEELDWQKLFSTWKYSCQIMNSSISKSPNIVEIKVDTPGWDWRGNDYVDWWDNEEIDLRRASLDKHGTRGLYFFEKTKVGTRTTAELLWNLRNDPEGTALTWIAASMWDKSKNLPEHWRGVTYRRVELLLRETINQLKQKGQFTWYHSSRDAMPITIHDNWAMEEALIPLNYAQLVGIASIENILTHSNWTIVRLFVDE